MRDHKSSEKMSNGQSRRHHTYHKEMDHAFTLIFHNIKRLQDDRICNSAPNIAQPQYDQQESINPAMTLKVPFAQPKRCMSDSSLKLAVVDTEEKTCRILGSISGRRTTSELVKFHYQLTFNCSQYNKLQEGRLGSA